MMKNFVFINTYENRLTLTCEILIIEKSLIAQAIHKTYLFVLTHHQREDL